MKLIDQFLNRALPLRRRLAEAAPAQPVSAASPRPEENFERFDDRSFALSGTDMDFRFDEPQDRPSQAEATPAHRGREGEEGGRPGDFASRAVSGRSTHIDDRIPTRPDYSASRSTTENRVEPARGNRLATRDLPALAMAREPAHEVADLGGLDSEAFQNATSTMRRGILTRAREHSLTPGGAGRGEALRLVAVGKVSAEISTGPFVASSVASMDRDIMKQTTFASDKDRETMGAIATQSRDRSEQDFAALSKEMEEQGFRLHEVVSLKDAAWFGEENYTAYAQETGRKGPSKAWLFAQDLGLTSVAAPDIRTTPKILASFAAGKQRFEEKSGAAR